MPKITVQFDFTPTEATAIDAVRGGMPLDEFIREAAQLGILSFKAEAIRKTQEQSYENVTMRTKNWQQFRQSVELVPPTSSGAEPKKNQEPTA